MLRRAEKCKKTNAALGGKMQKTPFSSEKTAFFTLKKMKQIGNSESVSNASDWLTIIQRMVRDFSSAKHQRTQPMKNVLGVF